MPVTSIARSFTLLRRAAVLWGTTATLLAAGPAWADPSGASASGYVTGDFVIGCTTCPHYLLQMSGNPAPFDGGPGAMAAEVGYAGTPLRVPTVDPYIPVPDGYTMGGGATLGAVASFEGLWKTPVLRAFASADNAEVFLTQTNPPQKVGIDLYQVMASADTVMRYTYTGSQATTFTFNFQVDGSVSSQLASVFASARAYSTADTGFETGLMASNYLSQVGVGLLGPTVQFNSSFALSVDVAAGQSF
ncbi:MAG: hypothetical protein CFE45_29645, partial [Burkholderiales bacterium PBB5]